MALDRTWFNALIDDDGSNTVGTVWGKDDIDALLDSVDAIQNAHCLNRLSTDLGVVSGAWTALTFDVREADPLGMYIGAGVVRVPVTGIYGVSSVVHFAQSGVGNRYMGVAVNGVPYPTYPPLVIPPANMIYTARAVEVLSLAANAQITTMIYQDTGTNMFILANSRFHVWRIA